MVMNLMMSMGGKKCANVVEAERLVIIRGSESIQIKFPKSSSLKVTRF